MGILVKKKVQERLNNTIRGERERGKDETTPRVVHHKQNHRARHMARKRTWLYRRETGSSQEENQGGKKNQDSIYCGGTRN